MYQTDARNSGTWFSARNKSCEFLPNNTRPCIQSVVMLLISHGYRLRRYISSTEAGDRTNPPATPRSPGPAKGNSTQLPADETRKTAGPSGRDAPVPLGADSQSSATGHMVAPRPGIDPYWPAEHLSGSEPKIYPGVVSRGQRSNSTRQGER